MPTRLTDHALTSVKAIILAVCLFTAFGGHYPPMFAQKSYRIETFPILTTEDAMQDDHILAINSSIKALQEQAARQDSDIAFMHGEERIIGGLLSLLTAGGLVLQFRQKKP
jgi:hypothetical protein